MCYSKEVQLLTALIIFISCVLYYFVYKHKYSKAWEKKFLINVLFVFLCIAGHQFFEFLSLVTQNQLIYKLGLIISICSMYFLLKTLEILTDEKLHSKIAVVVIAITAISIALTPVLFEGTRFFVRGSFNYLLWALPYLFLFIYWHICAWNAMKYLNHASKRMFLFYLFAIVDISFILSMIYVLIGYTLHSVNVCYDSPSIWCTFFVIQAAIVPFFLSMLHHHIFTRPKKTTTLSWKKTIWYLMVSLIILLILFATLPFFNCLSWKFVFP